MIENRFFSIRRLIPKNIKIVAVSKNQNVSSIEKLYKLGHKDFGENYVQEMMDKYKKLPKDIRWHMIGRIQSNKLKYIIPFIHLIHSVQKLEQIQLINKIALKYGRRINCLLQIKICNEKSKSGITDQEFYDILENKTYQSMKNVKIVGIMGMASFQELTKIHNEFGYLRKFYDKCQKKYGFYILSMGMSRDYNIAIQYGSTIVRLGTSIFGNRKKSIL
ncbi:alanine racemase domain-containing protein [Blattabacterium sp. (Blattella germanica) str. Bge]|uniref:YggS family pyridoxal phosphate-dependent enzyme n=1 Tax=Blattabacterium sp. (Blattella germanica) TaxID=624186 RepID=UPI0001BB61E9|nr:YggS family pyridoxal phosphate-dependent enzyme [Blattabacterium sp. (Blattella germanica)]ACY40435.1 alanine racemase domain-containing protein [Blattabacterium sp. (Blattella germanica) str. Bge]